MSKEIHAEFKETILSSAEQLTASNPTITVKPLRKASKLYKVVDSVRDEMESLGIDIKYDPSSQGAILTLVGSPAPAPAPAPEPAPEPEVVDEQPQGEAEFELDEPKSFFKYPSTFDGDNLT
jgi:hypothetical protein